MQKAQRKVIDEGYEFAKGKSRSKLVDVSESPKKRVKLSSEESNREISNLHKTIKTLDDRITFKKRQLEKERCMSNFKQCDALSAEILQVKKEKSLANKQLTALVKKEARSSWYHRSKSKEKASREKNNQQPQDKQQKILPLLRERSTSSTSSYTSSTDDTIILSDSSESTGFVDSQFDDLLAPVESNETTGVEEEKQDFCLESPCLEQEGSQISQV